MSDSISVYFESDQLPSISTFINGVSKAGLNLESWDNKQLLSDIQGYWPGLYEGKDAGFEFWASEADLQELEDWGIATDALNDRNYTIDFAFFGEPLELAAAAIGAAWICKNCDGLILDEDEFSVTKENCQQWLDRILDDVRKMEYES